MSAAKATIIAGVLMAMAAISVPFLDYLVPTWFIKAPPLPVPDAGGTIKSNFRTEQVEFLNGAKMQVCGEYWIGATPKFDNSSDTYATTVIALPDGTEVPFEASGGEPALIAPGCTVIASRLRWHRPNDPDSLLTIRQEIR